MCVFVCVCVCVCERETAWLCLSETAFKRRVHTSSTANPYYRMILLPPGRMRVCNTNFQIGKETQYRVKFVIKRPKAHF